MDRRSRDLGMLVLAEDLDAWQPDLLDARDFAEYLLGRSLWIAVRPPGACESDAFVAQVLRRPGTWVFPRVRC